ncbi:hypothetical protein HZU67_05449 [Apis mellifera carnica]|nr:hypothetical protein HZU67_05449 [Apis mellifera carnica]
MKLPAHIIHHGGQRPSSRYEKLYQLNNSLHYASATKDSIFVIVIFIIVATLDVSIIHLTRIAVTNYINIVCDNIYINFNVVITVVILIHLFTIVRNVVNIQFIVIFLECTTNLVFEVTLVTKRIVDHVNTLSKTRLCISVVCDAFTCFIMHWFNGCWHFKWTSFG